MNQNRELKIGLVCAISAFLFWGLVPIFFKQLASVSPFEIVSHRILWSTVILFVALALGKRLGFLKYLSRKVLIALFFSSILMTLNWLIFIWAIGENKILSTSLGYFINPLVSVVLGLLFLKERLGLWQWLAVGLALVGVLNQLAWVGSLPWVALALAFSFAFYGLIRKQLAIHPVEGLFVEACYMLPLSLGYFYWLQAHEQMLFSNISTQIDLLLIAAGLVTVIPLLLFAAGAQRLNLNVVGMAQYITPTMSFIIAIKLYDEPFSAVQLVTFVFIWLGLIIFTIEGIVRGKLKKRVSNL
ncbi:MAG: chloramphenicol-sensitive protein RarD [Oleiphilaceae bacterium]|jgi:chloramphenicol-sensitive protein RarD